MPTPFPHVDKTVETALRDLGQQLRDRRKKLKISATATAEAAGMSRVTLHRIERGESSVATGAYVSAILALGLTLELVDSKKRKRRLHPSAQELPPKIRLDNYPQLKRLAWQLKGTQEITPKEALDLYERNWRHVDQKKLDKREQDFLEALLAAFGRERLLV